MNQGERMLDRTSEAVWVRRMLSRENEVRRPRRDESNPPNGAARLLVEDEGLFHAMAEISRIPGVVELDCVIVDPSSRNGGLASSVVNKARSLWSNDPILSGLSFDDPFVPLPLLALTRDAAMANVLIQSGFQLIPHRRSWRSLWLIKSRFNSLPLRSVWYLHLRWFARIMRGLLIGEPLPEGARPPQGRLNHWFQRRRRAFTMLIHAGSAKVFITAPPSSSDPSSTSPLSSMHVHVIERETEKDAETSIEDWDIGRQSKATEIIDLTED